MEWMNRGPRGPQSANQPAQNAGVAGGPAPHNQHDQKAKGPDKLRVASIALLFSGTILVVALLLFIGFGGGTKKAESGYVNKDKLQAVFLNGGQVYFGRIKALNDDFLRLTDIYYLRVNQQVQPEQNGAPAQDASDISLVKLGCELHGPEDEMLINRSQVIFWENLKEDGQVTQAVAQYIEENPDGQDCEQPQQQAPQPQANPQEENQE
jgi:hypothetical protein